MIALLVAASSVPAAPVVALIAVGVLIAIGGHASRSQATVVMGIAIVFLATAIMVVGAFVAYQHDSSDPRPPPPKGGF